MNEIRKSTEKLNKSVNSKQSIELSIKTVQKNYEEYEEKPESHPRYSDEWKKFWRRRFIELTRERSVDPNEYDFKSEWIIFWTKRMKGFFAKEIQDLERELDKIMAPSDDVVMVIDSSSDSSSDSSTDSSRGYHEKSRKRSGENKIKYEDISSDSLSDDSIRSYEPPRRRKRSQELSRNYRFHSQFSSPSIFSRQALSNDNEPVTLISVCRLLSALETELGSLSNGVLHLLSKSIALEKLKANSSDEILMTPKNSIFLETVKEKMKGLLMLDLLPAIKTAAVKKCIQNIAKLIHQTSVRKEEKEISHQDQLKLKIAAKITEVLKTHGKEDCAAEELEVLVETFLEKDNVEVDPPVSLDPTSSYDKMKSLTDEDLEILLVNFTELKKEEQDQVIQFFSKLEVTEPLKVEKLRRFVKIKSESSSIPINSDDDSDDYSINEVIVNVNMKAASRNQLRLQSTVQDPSCLSDNHLTFGSKPLNQQLEAL